MAKSRFYAKMKKTQKHENKLFRGGAKRNGV